MEGHILTGARSTVSSMAEREVLTLCVGGSIPSRCAPHFAISTPWRGLLFAADLRSRPRSPAWAGAAARVVVAARCFHCSHRAPAIAIPLAGGLEVSAGVPQIGAAMRAARCAVVPILGDVTARHAHERGAARMKCVAAHANFAFLAAPAGKLYAEPSSRMGNQTHQRRHECRCFLVARTRFELATCWVMSPPGYHCPTAHTPLYAP